MIEKISLYIVWFIVLSLGSLIDARMWGKKEDDPLWIKKYTDIFWLGGYTVICPLLFMYIGYNRNIIAESLSQFIFYNILVGFSMSVFWDLFYSKIEHKNWIVPLPLWLIIPNPFSQKDIIVGFNTNKSVTYFHLLRLFILIVSIFVIF